MSASDGSESGSFKAAAATAPRAARDELAGGAPNADADALGG